jgi:hypothetical protein
LDIGQLTTGGDNAVENSDEDEDKKKYDSDDGPVSAIETVGNIFWLFFWMFILWNFVRTVFSWA